MLNKPTNFDPEKDIAYNKSSRELRDLRPSESRSISFGCNHLKEFTTTCPYPNPVYLTTCPYPLQLYGTSQPFPYAFVESIDGLGVQYVGSLVWEPVEYMNMGVTEVSVNFAQLVKYGAYTLPESDAFNAGGVSEVSVHFLELVRYGSYTPQFDAFNGGGVLNIGVDFVKLVGYVNYTVPDDKLGMSLSEISVNMV